MQASLIVKGRRLGMFLVQVNGNKTNITPLDSQGDMNDPKIQENLTADLRDSYSDEQGSALPQEVHLSIIKEILTQRGEQLLVSSLARRSSRLDSPVKTQNDPLLKSNVNKEFDPLAKVAS